MEMTRASSSCEKHSSSTKSECLPASSTAPEVIGGSRAAATQLDVVRHLTLADL